MRSVPRRSSNDRSFKRDRRRPTQLLPKTRDVGNILVVGIRLVSFDLNAATWGRPVHLVRQLLDRYRSVGAHVVGPPHFALGENDQQRRNEVAHIKVRTQGKAIASDPDRALIYCIRNEIANREMFVERHVRADKSETTCNAYRHPSSDCDGTQHLRRTLAFSVGTSHREWIGPTCIVFLEPQPVRSGRPIHGSRT